MVHGIMTNCAEYGDVNFPLDMGGGGYNALIEITLELMKR